MQKELNPVRRRAKLEEESVAAPSLPLSSPLLSLTKLDQCTPSTSKQGYCSGQRQTSQSLLETAASRLQGQDIWAEGLAGSEAGAFINTEPDKLPATGIELQYLAQREQKLICSQLVGRKCVSSWRRWQIAPWVFFFFFFD